MAAVLAVACVTLFAAPGQPSAKATTNPCENGTVVASPAANPGLVADCTVLLAAKDTVAGTATLNWSASTDITSWDGVTLSGSPSRVMELDLTSMSLTGTIPVGLGSLSQLTSLNLSANELTASIPREPPSSTHIVSRSDQMPRASRLRSASAISRSSRRSPVARL